MAKYSVISALIHRARLFAISQNFLIRNYTTLGRLWPNANTLKRALDKVERKFLNNNQENSNTKGEPSKNPSGNTTERDPNKEKYSKGHIVIPYTQGLGESIKKICSKYGIQTHFKGNKTIKEMLVKPKAKDPIDRKSRAIYWY